MQRFVSKQIASAVLLLTCAGAGAQLPEVSAPVGLPTPRDVSAAEYRAHLDALRSLVADCGRVVTACDAGKVGGDDRVHPAGGAAYVERYGWLRSLLEDKNDPTHRVRSEMLPHAEQRLSEQEAELEGAPAASMLDTNARVQRDAVLSTGEFRTVTEFSLRERIAAWISEKLSKLFGGAASLGRMAPWLGTALEWGALLLAITLLVVWVLRALDRQRALLGRLSGDGSRAEAEAESRAWVDLAKTHAAAGEWRDAVHCMYWATIVLLEDRRTLRRNTTRTPREALALIDVSSNVKEPLAKQTGSFERIWYGFALASEADFAEATQHYATVQSAVRRSAA